MAINIYMLVLVLLNVRIIIAVLMVTLLSFTGLSIYSDYADQGTAKLAACNLDIESGQLKGAQRFSAQCNKPNAPSKSVLYSSSGLSNEYESQSVEIDVPIYLFIFLAYGLVSYFYHCNKPTLSAKNPHSILLDWIKPVKGCPS
ncbi:MULTISPECIES: hypothetical protein [Ferrimonas]|uniref:hypothetical protein n=1 Tax=Ferrimonas TaxID=44011 RepID=UPI0012EC31D7|nr:MULTISPECIES: hypothetical protein [Ferrimonas]USD38712.1 hypothetical protein J8Z22_06305 [Ferrimonas sp. SCSIO 43195]